MKDITMLIECMKEFQTTFDKVRQISGLEDRFSDTDIATHYTMLCRDLEEMLIENVYNYTTETESV